MTFDPMAAAMDWLDAYRTGNIEAILEMYAADAVIECGCDKLAVRGKEAVRAYWQQRIRNYPVAELDDLKPSEAGAQVCYASGDGIVAATLEFDGDGRIAVQRCGPSRA